MTKTFCGKDCSVCIEKGSLSCTGCTDEQKQIQNKDCEIANCCLKKGHEECNTYGFRGECTMLAKQETMPADRIAQREPDEKRRAEAQCEIGEIDLPVVDDIGEALEEV